MKLGVRSLRHDVQMVARRRRSAAALSVAALLMTAGCSSSSDTPTGSGTPTDPSRPARSSSSAPGVGTSASPEPVPSPTALPVAVASVPGAVPGVKLAINSLSRVDDKTLILTITLTNAGSTPFSFNGSWREPGYGDPYTDRDLGGATLFDPTARQRYLVLRDAARRCLCSTNLGQGGTGNDGLSMGPGDVMTFFAYFPSPPSATKLQVSVPQYAPTSVSIT